MQEYYLRIEAVNLDYSIYDTYDISTIRGGSFMIHNAFECLLDHLNNTRTDVKKFTDLGSTASIGLFKFEIDKSNNVDKFVEYVLGKISEGIKSFSTFVWAILEFDNKKSFFELEQELTAMCRLKQYQNASFVLPRERQSQQACETDGVRPVAVEENFGGGDKKISSAVQVRQKEGKKLRNMIYKQLLGCKIDDLSSDPDEWRVTKDLESLARLNDGSKLDGKIAFIYLDGNRFGTIRADVCKDEQTYADFQKHIQENLRKKSLERILDFTLMPDNRSFLTSDNKIRLETLLWGGDEIEWVVPAWQGLNVLQEFFKCTSSQPSFQKNHLTHSAGVVFCHHNLPILQIRKYAKALCFNAKDKYRHSKPKDCFAFVNIVSFDYMSGDVVDFIDQYYHPARVDDFVIKANELKKIKNNVGLLKQYFPTNKIHEIIEAISKKKNDDAAAILERVLRLMPAGQKSILENTLQELCLVNNSWTRWIMISELLDYV